MIKFNKSPQTHITRSVFLKNILSDEGRKINSFLLNLKNDYGYVDFYQHKCKDGSLVLKAKKRTERGLGGALKTIRTMLFKPDGVIVDKTFKNQKMNIINNEIHNTISVTKYMDSVVKEVETQTSFNNAVKSKYDILGMSKKIKDRFGSEEHRITKKYVSHLKNDEIETKEIESPELFRNLIRQLSVKSSNQ